MLPGGSRFVCNAVNGAGVGVPCRSVTYTTFVVTDGGQGRSQGSAGHL